MTPETLTRLRRTLLRWYDANRRDLPWRRSRDPYAIWVSETMLQQTRVETVIPYYERFLARFPSVDALASADTESVYEVWAGLGYYSRARNLQAAAVTVVRDHGGSVPDDVEELKTLPGVGRYTAGAVASIAFDRRAPIVDGNVARVLSRLLGLREEVTSRPVQDRLWLEAEALAQTRRPGDLNQALMELGATLCTPRSPACLACPWTKDCDAHKQGDAGALPLKARKTRVRAFEAVAAWLPRRDRALMVRRPEKGLLGGLWELPGGDLEAAEAPEEGLRRHLRERLQLEVKEAERLGEVEHVFTHRKLRLHVFRCGSPSGRLRRVQEKNAWTEHRWLSTSAIESLAIGAPTRKALALFEGDPAREER